MVDQEWKGVVVEEMHVSLSLYICAGVLSPTLSAHFLGVNALGVCVCVCVRTRCGCRACVCVCIDVCTTRVENIQQ